MQQVIWLAQRWPELRFRSILTIPAHLIGRLLVDSLEHVRPRLSNNLSCDNWCNYLDWPAA